MKIFVREMENEDSHNFLPLIKTVHTLIWVFFNCVIVHLFYAAIADKVSVLTFIGIGLVVAEGLLLMLFANHCPLTLIARKYSTNSAANFDICLPEWLAKYNKLIYTCILGIIIIITIYQLIR
jgi:hypothetical protein